MAQFAQLRRGSIPRSTEKNLYDGRRLSTSCLAPAIWRRFGCSWVTQRLSQRRDIYASTKGPTRSLFLEPSISDQRAYPRKVSIGHGCDATPSRLVGVRPSDINPCTPTPLHGV